MFDKYAGCSSRGERDEIRVACETVEFFCQNSLDVPEVAQPLERVIEPFRMDESSRRGHRLLAQIELLRYPQCVFEHLAFWSVVVRRRSRVPFAIINESGGTGDQPFDFEERITRYHPGCEPEAFILWKAIHRSLDLGQAHRMEFKIDDRKGNELKG